MNLHPNGKPVFTVGLTGGIASGKSSVTRHFQSLGVPVVDADIVAREVVEAGRPALTALQALFTESILTHANELDRKKLRNIIFSQPAARKQVESILHPAIRERSAELLARHAEAGADYVVCAVPLLVETGQCDRYDRIAVVDVSVETQLDRVMARDDTSHENALKIIRSQASREERLAVADDIIDNSGTLQSLEARVDELHLLYRELAARQLR